MTTLYPVAPAVMSGTQLRCLVTDDHRLVVTPTLAELKQFVVDPWTTEDEKAREHDPAVRRSYEMRSRAQRLIGSSKGKRDNIRGYATYLEAGAIGGRDYVTPAMDVVFLESLTIYRLPGDEGNLVVVIPPGLRGVHVDAETQYAARLEMAKEHPETASSLRFPVVIEHGRSEDWASKAFHDLNILGVPVTTAVAITVNRDDAITKIAFDLIDRVPSLLGRISFDDRQASRKGGKIMTIVTLRRAVLGSLVGKKVFQLGNKPYSEQVPPEEQSEISNLWHQLFTQLDAQLRDEAAFQTVVRLPVVMTALGIALYEARAAGDVSGFLRQLDDVQWEKESLDGAQRWNGIAGKLTSKNTFSAGGGVKDLGYRMVDALTLQDSLLFEKIRGRVSASTPVEPVSI
jgi:hypothetical protein